MTFYSHPDKTLLEDHLIKVAQRVEEILDDTKLGIGKAGFYCGLLHDIGKINPLYQEIFSVPSDLRSVKEIEMNERFEHSHSPFSAWAAYYLLENIFDWQSLQLILHTIYGHHGRLYRSLPKQNDSDKFKRTQTAVLEGLIKFREQVKENKNFSDLDWDSCLKKFERPMKFVSTLENNRSGILDFLSASFLFSALLQADRGSFTDWKKPLFDLAIETKSLVKEDSPLAIPRTRFQKEATTNYDFSKNVNVINAPTGIGKTKVFLDLINEYRTKFSLERVFYFSPLLALTDDFEDKIKTTLTDKIDEVLSYNHLFSGSLHEKDGYESGEYQPYHWHFEDESFNRKFIITTTQRLLMTLYSNGQGDKLKLASLKNSLLILDEIQTVPKFLLPNLIEYLGKIAEKCGAKILLVSATIPNELKHLGQTKVSNDIIPQYLESTEKKIRFVDMLNIGDASGGKVLVMANTKKKTSSLFMKLNEQFDDVLYLSTGIRKKDRKEILASISSPQTIGKILVSTQVVEAGVDISFSHIYREVAPLDSIVQVMGRLNREKNFGDAILTIFQIDTVAKPYSELEYRESLDILKNITSSKSLYEKLPEYYKTISEKNQKNKELAKEILGLAENLDFDGAWEFVNSKVLPDDHHETVFVPKTTSELKEIRTSVLSKGKLDKNIARKFAYYTAVLPTSVKQLGISDLFDDEMKHFGILLPKPEHLDIIYDEKLGLDKWLQK